MIKVGNLLEVLHTEEVKDTIWERDLRTRRYDNNC